MDSQFYKEKEKSKLPTCVQHFNKELIHIVKLSGAAVLYMIFPLKVYSICALAFPLGRLNLHGES